MNKISRICDVGKRLGKDNSDILAVIDELIKDEKCEIIERKIKK
jgi:hypothetical protein